jgi:hypothetical protein
MAAVDYKLGFITAEQLHHYEERCFLPGTPEKATPRAARQAPIPAYAAPR